MIRLAVFDIDRTLISPEQGEMAPETVAALKQLQTKGIKTAIASGRLFSFLPPELLEVGFDYYIMSNGAYVTDPAGRVLAQEAVAADVADALVREMIRRNYPVDLRYTGGRRTGNPNFTVSQAMQAYWGERKFKKEPPKSMFQEYVPEEGTLPIAFGGYIPEQEMAEFTQMFPTLDFLPVFESPLCDINPAGVSKASGLKMICSLTGIDINETIAFGDDRNDLELIQQAGTGVAMGGGIQAVKDAADYVTASSEELGVVAALRHFDLID